ncbi:MAG: hypothetical protein AB9842_08190 [Bacteroidales bacterium]
MKKSKTKVHRWGNAGVILKEDHAYSFEIAGSFNIAHQGVLPLATRNSWENQPVMIGGFKVIPNGNTNLLPHEIRDVLEENNLTEGVIARKRGLLWGQGPLLYSEKIENNEKIRTWINDDEIESWLKSFNYEELLRRSIVDFFHMEGVFTKLYLSRGSVFGQHSRIAKVEHVGYHRSRLEWPEDNENVKNIIVGDWYNPNLLGLKRYPVFNPSQPFSFPISILFSNVYSFARDWYGLPAFYGALNWIKKGSAIPKILDSLTKNTLNIKYHIKSPISYWNEKKEMLIQKCSAENKPYTDKMLDDLKDETFKQLGEVLSGEQNVGKFFTSEVILNEDGKTEGWEIEAIDMKVKDFIDSQINVSKQADSAITSGLGLHPSLSNIMIEGKLASGSELLYALKLYLATETDIPESIICQALNYAIAANWPQRKLKIGFYHDIVKTEDSTSPEKRVKNVV